MALSATFSGSETAFYRMPRIRLKLDAMTGDRSAKRLLWLVNNPGFFVATVLVGNNVANYTVSMATVLFIGSVLPKAQGIAMEIGSTLVLAPFLFVYGEMFPKYLCLRAPNRMLRFLTPILMFFLILFLPVTMLFWLLNQAIARVTGKSKELLGLTLGRQELARVLDEGQETGILFDTQRRLADGVFEVSHRLVRDWAIPAMQWPTVTTAMKPKEVLEIARQHNLNEIPVYEADLFGSDTMPVEDPRQTGTIPIGFVRAIDLEIAIRNQLDEQAKQLLQLLHTELPVRSTVEIAAKHTLLTGMILMQTLHGTFGCVIDEHRRCIGFVNAEQLHEVLLGRSPEID